MAKKVVGDLSLELLGYNQSIITIKDDIVDDGTDEQIDGESAEDGRAVWNMIGKIGADVTVIWDDRRFYGRVLNVYKNGNVIYAEVNGLFNAEESSALGLVVFSSSASDPGTNGEGAGMIIYAAYPADGD